MEDEDVIVIGGGLAGLMAAVSAAEGGARTTLLERVSQPGGRARTKVDAGFHFNMGPHALYRGGPGMEALSAVGVRAEGAVPSQSGSLAVLGGRLFALPSGLVSLVSTSLLDLGDKLELARFLGAVHRLETGPYDRVPLESALRALLKRPMNRRLAEALVRLTSYSHAPSRVSGGAALEQVQRALARGVLYLHGGWQALVDGLMAVARERGVRVEAGQPVRAVEASAGRFRVRVDGRPPRAARAVVLAVGPREASRLVAGGADPTLTRIAARALPVRMASLDVALRRLPRPRRLFSLGIDVPTYVSVHSAAARLAPGGAALVHAARYLAPGEVPDAGATRVQLESELARLQPGWQREQVKVRFEPRLTVAHALPAAEDGGLAGRPGPALEQHPGLFLAGDWVGRRGLLADASLASGREAGLAAAARALAPARAA